uniref:Uncharacterized protein n=1 Tax=Aegilops tauschii subsp. strangulata TaxID=200361 RepID=A0A453N261_AEGTS
QNGQAFPLSSLLPPPHITTTHPTGGHHHCQPQPDRSPHKFLHPSRRPHSPTPTRARTRPPPHSAPPFAPSVPPSLRRPGTPIWGEEMGYVGSHGVATLRKYKYSGVDHSIVAKYILQPFWSRFVNVFPLWFP